MISPKRRSNTSSLARFSREEKAILTTLIYGDIFDFPLTEEELWNYLITDVKVDKQHFEKALTSVQKEVFFDGTYYALKSGRESISKRKKNLEQVTRKTSIATDTIKILSTIPTIMFIGISGGLAVKNVVASDDIDLFIITKKGTVYTTRFWVLMYLSIMRKRRKRNATQNQNKLCVNLLIDETEIAWPSEKRDLYTAHEIVQLQPVFEKNEMYKGFLQSNSWITKYLPNASKSSREGQISHSSNQMLVIVGKLLLFLSSESILRFLQLFIIKRHRTSETVTNTHLAFHPRDYRAETLRQLKLKMRQLGLLTNI